MPGQQILEDDRRNVDAKFLCSKCELLLIEPMQTFCGHLMCKSCLQLILRYKHCRRLAAILFVPFRTSISL